MPNSKQDPTGQARNRRVATRKLQRRLGNAERQVKALFRKIPRDVSRKTKIVNAQTTVYDYQMTLAEVVFFDKAIEDAINQALDTGFDQAPFGFYYNNEVESATRQGTAEEVRDFNQLITGAIIAGAVVKGIPLQEVPVEQILLSSEFRNKVAINQADAYKSIKTMSQRTAAQVLNRINSGMQAGKTPTIIANDISERFKVAKSDAKRISDTEINKAYNNAKLDATRLLGERTGLRAAVIHISALLPTTRAEHAKRHGNAYTVADQLQWWNTGANRINCHCSTRSVLIDNNGKVVQSELQSEIKQERSSFG